jgi:7-carboxy-7-deazaguanine synthase
VRQVTGFGVPHAVLTGGEPLLLAESIPLCERLRAGGLHVTVETAGTLYLPVQCDLMSISPKTSNSTPRGAGHDPWRSRHEETRHAPDVVRKLIREQQYQVKFVVDTPADLEEIDRYLAAMPEIRTSCVMLMPQGSERQALEAIRVWLEPYCREHGFSFCPRRQIEWFGSARGT